MIVFQQLVFVFLSCCSCYFNYIPFEIIFRSDDIFYLFCIYFPTVFSGLFHDAYGQWFRQWRIQLRLLINPPSLPPSPFPPEQEFELESRRFHWTWRAPHGGKGGGGAVINRRLQLGKHLSPSKQCVYFIPIRQTLSYNDNCFMSLFHK